MNGDNVPVQRTPWYFSKTNVTRHCDTDMLLVLPKFPAASPCRELDRTLRPLPPLCSCQSLPSSEMSCNRQSKCTCNATEQGNEMIQLCYNQCRSHQSGLPTKQYAFARSCFCAFRLVIVGVCCQCLPFAKKVFKSLSTHNCAVAPLQTCRYYWTGVQYCVWFYPYNLSTIVLFITGYSVLQY